MRLHFQGVPASLEGVQDPYANSKLPRTAGGYARTGMVEDTWTGTGHSSPSKARWGGKPWPFPAAWLLAGVGKRGARAISDWAHIKEGMSHANCETLGHPVPKPLPDRPGTLLCAVPAGSALPPWRQKAAKSSPDRLSQFTRRFPTLAILAGCKPCRREVPGQANKGVPTN